MYDHAARMRERAAAARAAGLCGLCFTGAPAPDRKCCARCLARQKQYDQRTSWPKKKERPE